MTHLTKSPGKFFEKILSVLKKAKAADNYSFSTADAFTDKPCVGFVIEFTEKGKTKHHHILLEVGKLKEADETTKLCFKSAAGREMLRKSLEEKA